MATKITYGEKSTQTEAQPEKNPLPWDVFYMSVAELESQRSNCNDAERVSVIKFERLSNITVMHDIAISYLLLSNSLYTPRILRA
jgi:hypothetical protein